MSGAGDSDGEPRVESRRDDDVVHIRLVNPRRRNALTWAMYDQLEEICAQLGADSSVRVTTIRGEGGAFAAGTDVRQFAEFRGGHDGVAYERRVSRVLDALVRLPMPVMGIVEGPAVGAGLAVAACCDILVASDTAYFGAPVARTLGNCLSPGVVARLQRRLGIARTMAMLLTSTMISADDAAQAGFVHAVVPPASVDGVVDDVVERLRGGAPLTLAAFKEIDRRLASAPNDDEVGGEDLIAHCYASADFAEGVAAFTGHRAPRWRGR